MGKLVTPHKDSANILLPTVDEVYQSAMAEHPVGFSKIGERRLKDLIEKTLKRIAEFEEVAKQPIVISQETARNIETIWVLSGTGSYTQHFKQEDNPKLLTKPWLGGMDRARIDRGILLARKVAEARSGRIVDEHPLRQPIEIIAETKRLIAEFGPNLVYNGYLVETEYFETLFEEAEFPLPRSKTHIIHKPLKVTADQVKTFEYHPDDPESINKEVVIVSSAPHLAARILHMADYYRPFSESSVPYVSPTPTPEEGRKEFALMETRGLLYYVYLQALASETPHNFQFLSHLNESKE